MKNVSNTIALHFQCNAYENGSVINIQAGVVTATVVVTQAVLVGAVVANCAAVLKQAPFAVVVAAMASLEHCENIAELDPEETDEYFRKPFHA